MLHLDLNHHTSPLSPKQNIILPTTTTDHHKIISWSRDKSFHDDLTYLSQSPLQSLPLTTTPLHLSPPSSPPIPSPTRDRSSSLSPVPDHALSLSPSSSAQPAPILGQPDDHLKLDQPSSQSTPLSELSPPPDQDGPAEPGVQSPEELSVTLHDSKAHVLEGAIVSDPTASSRPVATAPSEKSNSAQDSLSAHVGALTSGQSSSSDPVATPPPQRAASHSRSTASPALTDSKVITILELNAELLKVSMEFQSRGIPMSESRFQQFAIRLQSNLTWLAVAADQSRQGSHSNMSLPPMDPPAPVDFVSTERIQQLYADLPSIFAKEIARRQQMGILNNKRDRSDDGSDSSSKRRDTGESKSLSMPPPAVPILPILSPAQSSFSLPLSNGSPVGIVPPAPSLPSPSMTLPSLPTGQTEAQLAASSRDRARQFQIRQAVHQQQQATRPMSPTPAPPQVAGQGQSQQNAVIDPSAMSNQNMAAALAALGPNASQNFQFLQNPSHPFVQYMTTTVPGFMSLSVQQQLQRMQLVQAAIQARSQQPQNQQQTQQTGGTGQQRGGSMSSLPSNPSTQNSTYPGQNTGPASPASQMVGHQLHGQSQNAVFSLGNQGRDNSVADPRIGGPNINAQSLPNGISLNNLTSQQRQLLLQHQQLMSGRGGNPNPAAIMNPQAYVFQERLRQEQQRVAQAHQAHQAGSPTHAGSPLALPTNDSFPTLRSNSTIPGIARSTRSPSENAPSPVTPRAPTRGPSLGQEDYQRMMQAQQQQQRGQNLPFHAQMPQSSNWQQGQSMQMGAGQGSTYGMSPPGSAGHGTSYGVPSPTNSQNNWSQGPPGGGHYPFSPPPHQSERGHTPRHMSSTPAPQQIHSQNNSPPAEQAVLNEFDIFNWTQ